MPIDQFRRDDEMRLQQILDNTTTAAVFAKDLDGRYLFVNRAFEHYVNLTRKEILGRTTEEIFPREVAERFRANDRRAIAAGAALEIEETAIFNGRTRTLLANKFPLVGADGRPYAVCGITIDISDRKRADEALRASEGQYRAIFNATADALVLRDADFRIVDVNPAYVALSGYAREEVLGVDRIVANPAAVEDHVKALHRRALAGEAIHFETDWLRKDGTRSDVEVRGVPIQHQGRPHVLYIGRDITARKHAEAERARLEAQLRQAQKMEAIGQLTGGIAHDFNNILTSIMGYLALAAERDTARDDRKLGHYVEQAMLSSGRARDLIQQMLTFSRGQRSERRPVDLRRVAAEAARLLRSSMPATLELETLPAQDVPLASLNRVQAEQVLLNLCINARDALQGQGKVRVFIGPAETRAAVCASCRAQIGGEFVELAVTDDGPGIAPEVMERMFEPFFSTKEVGKGSGMGLATVHGIVHEHGGHVVVESAPGRGATFRVLFPVLRADEGALEHETLPGYVPASRKAALRGRVLLVDDEEMVVGFMRELLEDWGLEVTAKTSGTDAREEFARAPEHYDLIVSDQAMPRVTGLQLARDVHGIRSDVPVILYTGYADELTEAQAEAAGICALLRKPVEPAALHALLKTHLPGGAHPER
jgi:PAS domain S-box-containing protein